MKNIEIIGDEKIFDSGDISNPTEIDSVINWLTELRANGATHIKWDATEEDNAGNTETVEAHGCKII